MTVSSAAHSHAVMFAFIFVDQSSQRGTPASVFIEGDKVALDQV